MTPAARLRGLLGDAGVLVLPGAADALTARLIADAGYPAVYATGAGIANALLGLPDLGLTTMTEVAEQVRRIADAVSVPVIADVDTGYGNPLNVIRTVRTFERAGAAGVQLEDQVAPKRCGHFAGKEVIPAAEMVAKVRAAVHARSDPDFVLIARTDAIATHGMAEAIARGRAYAAAGADLIFVEAPTTVEDWARLPREIPAPLVANMTEGAKSPPLSVAELGAMGYRVALYPNTLLRVAMQAVQNALTTLRDEGSSAALVPQMVTWTERQRLVGLPEYEALERDYVRAVDTNERDAIAPQEGTAPR